MRAKTEFDATIIGSGRRVGFFLRGPFTIGCDEEWKLERTRVWNFSWLEELGYTTKESCKILGEITRWMQKKKPNLKNTEHTDGSKREYKKYKIQQKEHPYTYNISVALDTTYNILRNFLLFSFSFHFLPEHSSFPLQYKRKTYSPFRRNLNYSGALTVTSFLKPVQHVFIWCVYLLIGELYYTYRGSCGY